MKCFAHIDLGGHCARAIVAYLNKNYTTNDFFM